MLCKERKKRKGLQLTSSRTCLPGGRDVDGLEKSQRQRRIDLNLHLSATFGLHLHIVIFYFCFFKTNFYESLNNILADIFATENYFR